jgi:hypothetical protein
LAAEAVGVELVPEEEVVAAEEVVVVQLQVVEVVAPVRMVCA